MSRQNNKSAFGSNFQKPTNRIDLDYEEEEDEYEYVKVKKEKKEDSASGQSLSPFNTMTSLERQYADLKKAESVKTASTPAKKATKSATTAKHSCASSGPDWFENLWFCR